MINGIASIFGYDASARAVRVIKPGTASNDAAFQARREEAARIRRAMTGHCEQDVTAALQKRYHPETFLQLKFNHGVQTHNRLGSDVLSKLAVGWQQGASYSLIGPDNAPVEDPAFPAFIKATNLIYDREAGKNPFFKEALDSQRAFAKLVVPYWNKINGLYFNLGSDSPNAKG